MMNRKITDNFKTVNLDQPIETRTEHCTAKFMGTVPDSVSPYCIAWKTSDSSRGDEWISCLFKPEQVVKSFRNVSTNPFREALTGQALADELAAWIRREAPGAPEAPSISKPSVRFGQYIVNNYARQEVMPVSSIDLSPDTPSGRFSRIFYEPDHGKAFVMIYDFIKGDE